MEKGIHDPLQRATSFGPYTSREMCRVLIAELNRRNIPVRENRVVVSLLTLEEDDGPHCDTWFETAWAAFRNGDIFREV